MSIINLFPIKIYHTVFDGVDDIKKSIAGKLESVYKQTEINNQSSMRGNGLCSYNTVRDLHTWPELKVLVEFINYHSNLYWQELNYNKEMKPAVYEMWSNIYKEGSFIEAHNHSPIHLTASFYLQQPDNGGNIVFENPITTLLKHQPYDLDAIRYKTIFDQEVEVKTGSLVIFPGWINHKTMPNNTKEDRIIIGSNVCNAV